MTSRVMYWVNEPSLHVAPVVRELAAKGWDVYVVADMPTRARLSRYGPVNFGNARVVIAPSREERRLLETRWGEGATHVFTGLGAYPGVSSSFASLRYLDCTRLVFSEPWNPLGRYSHLRRLRFLRRWRRLGSDVDRMLLAGDLARRQFAELGAPVHTLAEYGYFVDVDHREVPNVMQNETFRVVYVGQMIQRKRPDLVLESVRGVADAVKVEMIGDGPLLSSMKSLAQADRLPVRFIGAISNADVRRRIAKADLLVLPSDFDGWGAVVNEALGVGVPCLTSDMVGARSLFASPLQGEHFRHGDLGSLAERLTSRVSGGPITVSQRGALRQWAKDAIAPQAVAEYVTRVFATAKEETHPPVPWRGDS